jgi:hypothetical protein
LPALKRPTPVPPADERTRSGLKEAFACACILSLYEDETLMKDAHSSLADVAPRCCEPCALGYA